MNDDDLSITGGELSKAARTAAGAATAAANAKLRSAGASEKRKAIELQHLARQQEAQRRASREADRGRS